MSENVLGVDNLGAGLNNQRLGLLGLIALAHEQGGKVSLPTTVIDFTPVPRAQKPKFPARLPFEAVFDRDSLVDFLRGFDLWTELAPATLITFENCFTHGSATARRMLFDAKRSDCLAASFLIACKAAEPLRDLSSQSLSAFGARPIFALQLRIERDWQEYIAKKTPFDQEDTTSDYNRIFQKIARNADLLEIGRVLACCDEDDLLVEQAEIKAAAGEHGLDLVFKSEIDGDVAMPTSRLQRSFVDFGLCLKMDRYVGLTRSTFSNMLCTIRSLELYPDHPNHYIYNAPGDVVAPRWDRGKAVDPVKAACRS